MDEIVTHLRSLIDSERFLSKLNQDSLDDLFDSRDSDPFESEWLRVNEVVEQSQLESNDAVDALRESAFKRAFAITKSPDACGYISEDVGLIADAVRAGVADPWLASLTAGYVSGELPHGELAGDPRSLSEIISQIDPLP